MSVNCLTHVNEVEVGIGLQYLLPTGSEERGVLAVGSIPNAILPSCQDVRIIAL